jgi:hypothetical protein
LGIDKKEYVSYYLGEYYWKEDSFGIIESYFGETNRCDKYISGKTRRPYNPAFKQKDSQPIPFQPTQDALDSLLDSLTGPESTIERNSGQPAKE